MSLDEPPNASRRVDAVAVAAIARRLAHAEEAPWLHREVARRMAERLQIIRLRPKALADWCSFTGGGAELLAKAYPGARRLLVEPQHELAERSRRASQQAWWSPRHWARPAVSVLAPEEVETQSVELLWSNMSLHAAVDPPAVLAEWHRALVVDGFVMFSCLGPDTLRELRSLYARLDWPAPSIDFVDMHDLGDMMVRAGFADPVMDQETLTLTWDGPDALLAELRTLGGNASPDRFGASRGRRWLQRFRDELSSMAALSSRADGRIALTFEVAYGHAFRAPLRVKGGGETAVSLEEMRAMVKDRPRRGGD